MLPENIEWFECLFQLCQSYVSLGYRDAIEDVANYLKAKHGVTVKKAPSLTDIQEAALKIVIRKPRKDRITKKRH